jgi:thiamine-monophosphate kinase
LPNVLTTETTIIKRIRRALPSRDPARLGQLRIGIGDDAAVLRLSGKPDWVVTCDMFLENVHFLANAYPPDAVGYKALARATSDLAAMGSKPRYFLLSLALPSHRTGQWLDGMLAGMSRAARRFGLVLAGGDTAQNANVAFSITVLGEAARGRAVTRAGARPGDLIFVSGRLGAAQLGLELILRGLYKERRLRPLLQQQFNPPLRLELGKWLANPQRDAPRGLASAMIDTSDGLSTDLGHICAASGVGAKIYAERIPAVRIPAALASHGLDPSELALHGGEDYELLFTAPRRLARFVPKSFGGVPLTQIGEITRSRAVVLVDHRGGTSLLEPKGWDHFRSRQSRTRAQE